MADLAECWQIGFILVVFKAEKSTQTRTPKGSFTILNKMITKVDENTPEEKFDNFIDDAFVSMCKSRDKTKHTAEYDDEKQEMIFHYADGTADRVQITPVENYKPTRHFVKVNQGWYLKRNNCSAFLFGGSFFDDFYFVTQDGGGFEVQLFDRFIHLFFF